MKQMETIFSTDEEFNGFKWDSAKNIYYDECGEEYTSYEVGDIIADRFCETMSNIKACAKSESFFVKAELHLWNGITDGYKVVDADDIGSIFFNYDNVEIKVDGKGKCFAYLHHHDGTNVVEIRPMTAKGETYYNNNQWSKSIEGLIERLMDSHYSSNLNFKWA